MLMLENYDVRVVPNYVPLFEPIEGLGGRVGLVVILGVGEVREFVEVLSEICSFVRYMNKSTFNHARHRIHPDDFVHRWLVLLDSVHSLSDQFLDTLTPR